MHLNDHNPNFIPHPISINFPFVIELDDGKILTGKPNQFDGKKHGFPVDFPWNQSNDFEEANNSEEIHHFLFHWCFGGFSLRPPTRCHLAITGRRSEEEWPGTNLEKGGKIHWFSQRC